MSGNGEKESSQCDTRNSVSSFSSLLITIHSSSVHPSFAAVHVSVDSCSVHVSVDSCNVRVSVDSCSVHVSVDSCSVHVSVDSCIVWILPI